MNEHPGVRPIVVQPQQHTTPTRALPRGATDMPLGLSANSVGLTGSRGFDMRRILFVGIPVAVLLAVALGAWLFVRNLATLSPQTLTNSAYEYDFLFYKKSETVNLVAGEGLKYDDKALVIAKPTGDNVVSQCREVGKGWTEIFRVPIEGVDHPVCRYNDNIFLVTFYHGKTKHLLEVTYTSAHAIKTDDVRQIMSSLHVSLP